MKKLRWLARLTALSLLVLTCKDTLHVTQQVPKESGFATPRTVDPNPSPTPLTPQESLKAFRLPKGYRMELVASEPMINEPVAIAWDGNARMYVAQMETYMQTVDTTGEHVPTSRVMLLEDTDNDGKMDKSSVFIDNLMLPRMLQCVGKELLVNETDTYDIYAYQDTNGDGIADKKRPVYQLGKKAPGNLEHQRSGLDWNLDNWIYVTVDPVRFRYKNRVLKADTLPHGSNGQWGLTHDNYGRLYFSVAGGENAGLGFQINPAYGKLEFKDAYIDSTFGPVWPIIKTVDVQGGKKRLREDSTLNHFTAGNGQSIFRGDHLPKSLVGDYLISEPVARIIRRAKVINKAGKTTLVNAYEREEFIASRDMNFRAVNTYTGPDGCLYIVDMNRGIIQEGTWTRPGTYLRDQILRLGLDKNKQRGRIYRLVYEGMGRGPKPRMLDEPSSQLVTYLDHPNGWWRDNAQKELVIRGDQSVIPALKQMALGNQGASSAQPSHLGRLHALWTLEGLEASEKAVLLKALDDEHAQVRKAAIWISEPFLKGGDEPLLAKVATMKQDASDEIKTQLLLSLFSAPSPLAKATVEELMASNADHEMLKSVQESLFKTEEIKKYGSKLTVLDEFSRKMVQNGSATFKSICASCHGPEGKGLPSKVAPPLGANFKRFMEKKDGQIRILLHGLTGPVDGVTYPDIMPPMGGNSDEWIASVLSYIRYDLALAGQAITGPISAESLPKILVKPQEVKKIREETQGRSQFWTWAELDRPVK